MKPLLSVKDAKALLAIGARKLWELTNSGDIPHVRIGRAIRYDVDDLEQWIVRRKRRGHSAEHCKTSSPRSTSCDADGDQERTTPRTEVG